MKRFLSAVSILATCLMFQPASAQFCPADTTGDLKVDVADLLQILNAWGPLQAGNPYRPDTNNDGVVNTADLLTVISGWGECKPYFELVLVPGGPADGEAWDPTWCTYKIDASDPGSALKAGDIICTSCPLTWMNACPDLAKCTFKGVPGAPGAMSTGVNATRQGNGFCQDCPLPEAPNANARRYRRTG